MKKKKKQNIYIRCLKSPVFYNTMTDSNDSITENHLTVYRLLYMKLYKNNKELQNEELTDMSVVHFRFCEFLNSYRFTSLTR